MLQKKHLLRSAKNFKSLNYFLDKELEKDWLSLRNSHTSEANYTH